MTAAPQRLPGWVQLGLAALVVYRIVYHSQYLADVPFAMATFSDGRQYEMAAVDILTNAPLGSDPFYLQAIYAYFMAGMMGIWPNLAAVLLAQLTIAGLTLWVFFRAVSALVDRRTAGLATLVLMAYPMLAFYENKFLTSQLAVTTSVLVLAAVAWAVARPTAFRLSSVGLAAALAVLARPNLVVALPFFALAVVSIAQTAGMRRRRGLLAAGLGLVVGLAPLALRNYAVTGNATIFPAHGGGTSFYIGNNREARGVWNTAGGLLSGDVSRERGELAEALGVDTTDKAKIPAAIGRALYARAFAEIAEDPVRWLELEARKLWLVAGNNELTQDYDRLGEQELVPASPRGLPFGPLWILGVVGLLVLRREAPQRRRPLEWVLIGLAVAVLAGNLLYFTSSQHRLPLVVPLAVWAGLGLPHAFATVRSLRKPTRAAVVWVVVVFGMLVLTALPRSRQTEPTAVHYYNLAIAYLQLDQPRLAIAALDRALERRPDHPVLRIERATTRRRLGDDAGALADLEVLAGMPAVPSWVRQRARDEARRMGVPAP